jgi:hypothetical protein
MRSSIVLPAQYAASARSASSWDANQTIRRGMPPSVPSFVAEGEAPAACAGCRVTSRNRLALHAPPAQQAPIEESTELRGLAASFLER